MRSELVSQAVGPMTNRFLLMHVVSTLTRKFHRPTKERVPDSINAALRNIGDDRCIFLFTRDSLCVVYASPQMPHVKKRAEQEISPPEWGEQFESLGIPCEQMVETS